MVNIVKFTSIKEIADDLLMHPMLAKLQLEGIIRYALIFAGITGFNELYLDKVDTITVKNHRAQLPCDLIRINQVRTKDNIYLKALTGSFLGSLENPGFKVQGGYLFTNISEGELEISYKAEPTDDEGLPLILDNEKYKEALKAYIKKEQFQLYFEEGKLDMRILQNAQQDYGFKVKSLFTSMALPTLEQMQSISNMWNKMHLTTKDFYQGFEINTNIDTYKQH